ncbi:outer membrane transport energization protein ExbD [Flavobacterium glycines]|uniref:Biopolymer transport ExbD protein n=1 Tax=Flavobacterium glycines TaxID=551990 RepID=A0A1B9DN69_9FLAO|nr:biopolymer transporter ExbD [Flavobacterium glycines]OCB71115.1 biopolymer transporter ExbD [Flavobacterium glycines]GEL10934.1 biopolymer transport ExbD protein [Flavobacterium glycines]SDI48318.1 outer membrane transport energization protein ExbD [Flavobacterium glycines]
MAELNTGDSGGGKGGKVRSKKQNSKVDLTAMVDLAFLLITFFMLTTSLSKPQAMSLGLPDKDPKDKTEDMKVDENRTMTVLLGGGDKMYFYMGLINNPMAPKLIAYGKDGIRKELIKRKKDVAAYTAAKGKPEQGMIVIIKPGKKSNYKNVVDILDEMAISSIPTYTIVNDFLPEEQKLLEGK